MSAPCSAPPLNWPSEAPLDPPCGSGLRPCSSHPIHLNQFCRRRSPRARVEASIIGLFGYPVAWASLLRLSCLGRRGAKKGRQYACRSSRAGPMTPSRLDAFRRVSALADALVRLADRMGIRVKVELAVPARRR